MSWTSTKSYYEILGSLPERRAKVFKALQEYVNVAKMDPPTARELCKFFDLDGGWKRLPELEKENLVHRGPARACKISGKTANTWIPGPKPAEGDLF